MAHLELRRTRLQLGAERQTLDGVLRMANTAGGALYANARAEIFARQDQRLGRIATADLQYAEALGNCLHLCPTREKLTVYGTLEELEAKLPGRDFARVHRQYSVRPDRIVAVEADMAVLGSVQEASSIHAPVRVPIGSAYKAALLGRLNLA